MGCDVQDSSGVQEKKKIVCLILGCISIKKSYIANNFWRFGFLKEINTNN